MNSIFPKKIENKFTANLKDVLKVSEQTARNLSHKEISIDHIVFSIATQKGSMGSNIIGEGKFDVKKLQERIEKLDKVEKWQMRFSDDLKIALQEMVLCASRYNHNYIGTEHLLSAILANPTAKVENLFKDIGIDSVKLRENLEAILESSFRFSGIMEVSDGFKKGGSIGISNVPGFGVSGNPSEMGQFGNLMMPGTNVRQSAIETFCVDMNERVESKKFDAVIGREKEIAKVINILSRKSKNNPILIGEPGVGKTAIVQGLVQKILEGEVPSNLANKRVYSLDLGLLIAGTVFRGEFESRLKDVIAEAEEDPTIILFIDEIHTIIGAGNTGGSGSLDAANILKPPLSRGEISCIGATTIEEYRKHFKKDAALDRRFQMVLVEEPSIEDSEKVLFGVKGFYEKHHNIVISDEAIRSAVELSHRFINDRFLPDKALDVLDEAAALVRSRHGNKNYFKQINDLIKQRNDFACDKETKVEGGQYEEALKVKTEEDKIKKKIEELNDLQERENAAKITVPVTADDIGEVVEQMTGIPVNNLVAEEKKHLKNLEKELKKEIVGQDEAVKALAKSIRRSRSGITEGNRPIGVFMFLGPTGVGKTELVKVLAEKVYRDKKALIRVDMSEFMERHNLSRLVGAPAGYIGFEEGGKLTEAIRLHPYSVVLFDEIEKAHPDVFNIMLQIFEDGELTDAAGRKADFRNAIIIMTSNLGTEELTGEAVLGFSLQEKEGKKDVKDEARNRYLETKENLIQNLKGEFRPEFLNRIDEILVFNPLSRKDIEKILENKFEEIKKRIYEKRKIVIEIDDEAMKFIAEKSFDPNEGARLIRKNLRSMVEDLISERMIKGDIKDGGKIKIISKGNKIVLQ